MTCDARTIETLAGRAPPAARMSRFVADEDQPVVGVAPGVVEGTRNDLGDAVVAAHRVDRDTNAASVRAQRRGLRSGHRVSVRRRRWRRA